jgi:glycosyltransferase involved in cell wall biosynthesis
MKNTVTFILFCYNEEKRIAHAIRCFKDYGPIILMDGGSTDRTREIAEGLGATFLSRPESLNPSVETEVNLDFIKAHTDTPWIYWGYVDNIAPRSLVEKLVAVAKEGTYKRVLAPLYTYLWGNTDHYAQRSYILAAFHRDYMDFKNNPIHSMGRFAGQPEEDLRLPDTDQFALRHFSTYNESKFVSGYMRYAEQEAMVKFKSGERFSVLKLLAAMLRYIWIYRRSLRSPRLGILIMLNMAFGRLMTYTRLYELEHDLTLETIEDNYSRKKEEQTSV